jgi:hypothetical protein
MVACTLLPWATIAASEAMDDSELLTAEYPEWFLESFLNLQEDLANTRDAGKKGLIVVFSTVGCSYCYKLASETLRNPEVIANLRRDFDALASEIFSDDLMISPSGEELPVKEFAKNIGADLTPGKGIPGRHQLPAIRATQGHRKDAIVGNRS